MVSSNTGQTQPGTRRRSGPIISLHVPGGAHEVLKALIPAVEAKIQALVNMLGSGTPGTPQAFAKALELPDFESLDLSTTADQHQWIVERLKNRTATIRTLDETTLKTAVIVSDQNELILESIEGTVNTLNENLKKVGNGKTSADTDKNILTWLDQALKVVDEAVNGGLNLVDDWAQLQNGSAEIANTVNPAANAGGGGGGGIEGLISGLAPLAAMIAMQAPQLIEAFTKDKDQDDSDKDKDKGDGTSANDPVKDKKPDEKEEQKGESATGKADEDKEGQSDKSGDVEKEDQPAATGS
ncbi:hypothetical protein [Nocardia sp. NPDC050793]|uniref:hypothetical protein n=1 Tax=Nocardia sp. NPDC050793 TaxID=3155159 RepID=UPI0033F0EE64